MKEEVRESTLTELDTVYGGATRCPDCWAYLKYEDQHSKGFFTITYREVSTSKTLELYKYGFICPCCGCEYGGKLEK